MLEVLLGASDIYGLITMLLTIILFTVKIIGNLSKRYSKEKALSSNKESNYKTYYNWGWLGKVKPKTFKMSERFMLALILFFIIMYIVSTISILIVSQNLMGEGTFNIQDSIDELEEKQNESGD